MSSYLQEYIDFTYNNPNLYAKLIVYIGKIS